MLSGVTSNFEDPCIFIARWTVVETELGERHLVGDNLATGLGRVSSAICQYDPVTKQFVTRSGRLYRVTDRGQVSREAWFAWEAWASFNGVRTWREVMDDYETVTRVSAAGGSLGQ